MTFDEFEEHICSELKKYNMGFQEIQRAGCWAIVTHIGRVGHFPYLQRISSKLPKGIKLEKYELGKYNAFNAQRLWFWGPRNWIDPTLPGFRPEPGRELVEIRF